MRRLVDDMAAYYRTTKHMARTRLMDFGYNEVRGIMQSANGGLIPAYVSSLKDNQTYTIDESDALKEFVRNPEFRKTLLTGCYVYAEGHYCLDSTKYIFRDHAGNPHLTSYAREHMERCCLVFEVEYEKTGYFNVNGVLYRSVGRGKKTTKFVRADGSSPVTREGRELRAKVDRERKETGMYRKSFNDMTVELMDQRGVKENQLAEATGLSVGTIKNMRNDPNRVFPIQEIVAVCIALHLSPNLSEKYIEASPSKFADTTDMSLYEYALRYWYNDTVAYVNRKLVESDAQPLTNLVEGFDENGVEVV